MAASAVGIEALTFVDGGSCNVIEHESSVDIIDVFQHLEEVDVLFKTDPLHHNDHSQHVLKTPKELEYHTRNGVSQPL